jgi:hypothetical protein
MTPLQPRSHLIGIIFYIVFCCLLTITGCSYPPTYDGIGADEYMEWEIAIDNIFAIRFMCPRRNVKNAASVL